MALSLLLALALTILSTSPATTSTVDSRGPLCYSCPRTPLHAPMGASRGGPGEPLFLTPLIKAGEVEKAQNLSKVGKLPGNPQVDSYAGYLTVDDRFNSNMFFWFFPALVNPSKAPVLLWLQGGPGGSSLFGLFIEHGPVLVTSRLEAKARDHSWASQFNMLYIDNPVGTGFSFTNSPDGLARNQTAVGENLFEALQQFFALFPQLQENDFYVTGESYAGKYVPAISYKIYKEGKKANFTFKGMAIGDGLCDPETMTDYGDLLYQIGLIDDSQRQYMQNQSAIAVELIQQKKWLEAFQVFDALLNGDTTGGWSYFKNVTGFNFYYNYLLTEQPEDFTYYSQFINLDKVRRAIHVGNSTFHDGKDVEQALLEDFMQSVKPWVAELMDNNYKVLIYNGQLDIIVGYTLTESFLNSIQWSGADQYKLAQRRIWRLGSDVAGYVKTVGRFTEVVVRNAGHILPYDQPLSALDMITRFVYDKPFAQED